LLLKCRNQGGGSKLLIDYKKCADIIFSIHQIRPKNVYHIGAHVGEELDAYVDNGVRKIIWFEANESLLKTLSKNIYRFRWHKLKQQIINKALWNENTELEFNISNNTQCSSFLDLDRHVIYYPEVRVVDKHKIKAYRLDSLIENHEENILFSDPQFINIDTQGSELKIIEGMGRYIGIRSLIAIYIEVNKENLYKNVPQVDELDSYLRPHNFHRMVTKWTSEGWGDALYIRSRE